jgi:hypothetical protein
VTRGGNVVTHGVTEAPYSVSSDGGNMQVGKVKATFASVCSGGGSVSGSLTAGGTLTWCDGLVKLMAGLTCSMHRATTHSGGKSAPSSHVLRCCLLRRLLAPASYLISDDALVPDIPDELSVLDKST